MSFLWSVPTYSRLEAPKKYSERRARPAASAPMFSMQPFLLERQRVPLELRHHPIPGHEIPAQNLLRQGVLDLRLNRPLQGPRAIHRIEARFADLVARVIVQPQSDVALRQSLPQASQLDIDDGPNLLTSEGMKHHDLIDPVDEFRPEMLGHHLHDRLFHLGIVGLAPELLDDLRP